jgi:DNA-binding MarR family transcriptional regulator
MFDNAPPRAGDVRALAHQLLSWADHLSVRPDPARELTEEGRHDLILGLALATREARRLRAQIFFGVPLRNPNWDVMLDLFIQEMNGFRTSLDHLALNGDLPATTVHESVDVLTKLGLLERTTDRFDNRVAWLSLTVAGRQGMFDLLEQATAFVRPVVGRLPDREDAEA